MSVLGLSVFTGFDSLLFSALSFGLLLRALSDPLGRILSDALLDEDEEDELEDDDELLLLELESEEDEELSDED